MVGSMMYQQGWGTVAMCCRYQSFGPVIGWSSEMANKALSRQGVYRPLDTKAVKTGNIDHCVVRVLYVHSSYCMRILHIAV